MSLTLGICALATATIALLLYVYFKKRYNYWSDRGVPFLKPEVPIGNLRGVGTKVSNADFLWSCYNKLKGKVFPIGGIFFFHAPVAVVLDLDLLKSILIKDFQHFQNRGFFTNEIDDPLSCHLFSLEGEKWKNLRAKLTPTFTSGKIKMMHPTIVAVAEKFKDHLVKITQRNSEVDLKELSAHFTTDVIGNVAFGFDCDSINDPESPFRKNGKRILEFTAMENLQRIFLMMFPDLGRKLRMSFNKAEVKNFFMKLISETVNYREANNVKRNDFMSLLLQLKNSGPLEGDKSKGFGELSLNELAAQVFLFFAAGFDTSASTMAFVFYALALNPDIQEKVRQELRDVLERHEGKMTYEAVMELQYLDQVINETLRMYPVVDTLFRKTTIPYKIPNTDVVLEKDTLLLISVMGFHRDPQIYPDPNKFHPERFTKENISKRHPYAWLPFGVGPRNCIGMRMGMMQSRLGIATVLQNFKVSPSKKTLIPMKFQPESIFLTPFQGLYLNLEPLDSK